MNNTYHHTEPQQEKAGPLFLNIGPWGPHPLTYGACLYCGCINDQYLSPYSTTAKWLPRLLMKSRPFVFKYRPWAHTLQQMGYVYHCGCVDY